MKLAIGCDHAAFSVKEELKKYLQENQYQVIDVGTDSDQSCDYPILAFEVCKVVVQQKIPGILLCGSGIGMAMAANRFKWIRAAVCRTVEDAL
ncbi:MAG: RpiB/LacA/LacB family sugar-phosphate isomerase, partial [Pseudomonadota bacterium]